MSYLKCHGTRRVPQWVSSGCSIAAFADPGMLDVAGFDTATPQRISDFVRCAL